MAYQDPQRFGYQFRTTRGCLEAMGRKPEESGTESEGRGLKYRCWKGFFLMKSGFKASDLLFSAVNMDQSGRLLQSLHVRLYVMADCSQVKKEFKKSFWADFFPESCDASATFPSHLFLFVCLAFSCWLSDRLSFSVWSSETKYYSSTFVIMKSLCIDKIVIIQCWTNKIIYETNFI